MSKKPVICSFCGNGYKPSFNSKIYDRDLYEYGIGCSSNFIYLDTKITYKNILEIIDSLLETSKISIYFGYGSKYDMERYHIRDNTLFKLIKKPKFPNIKLYNDYNKIKEISFDDLYIIIYDNCYNRYKDNYFTEYND